MTARLIMKLRVEKMRFTTPDVVHMQLVHPLRPTLPEWSAGAHVDLRMPDGRVRQYSLCGDPDDRSRYEIAIKREATGRGGSIWVHENLREGSEVHISAPRNNLPLSAKGKRYILVAGGIGITPLLSMARTLKRWDKDYTLLIARGRRPRRRCSPNSETFAGRACSAGSPETVLALIRRQSARMTRIRTSISAGRNGFWMPCSRP